MFLTHGNEGTEPRLSRLGKDNVFHWPLQGGSLSEEVLVSMEKGIVFHSGRIGGYPGGLI